MKSKGEEVVGRGSKSIYINSKKTCKELQESHIYLGKIAGLHIESSFLK
jgi:hypothetical protein